MIDAPEASVQLKDEDTKKIELVQIRLSNLQAEVLYATKRLATLVEEENKARDAREYAFSEKVKIEQEVEDLRKQKEDLAHAVQVSTDELRSHQSQHETMRDEHTEKQSKLSDREKVVQAGEKSLADRMQEHSIREKTLDEQRSEVENAQQAFLRALESVTWA